MPQDAVIQCNNIKFSYAGQNSYALNGVSLSVQKGEFVSLIGHNGSGKSTLARIICGLLEADSGSVTVFGLNLADGKNAQEIRKKVGIVFQNPDNQTVASIVEDDIAFGPENIGVEREEIGRRISWALKTVGMEKFRHSTPARLSGGQKQRIAVAGVLALKPEVIVLDESTAMLDPAGRREVMDVVRRLNKEEGLTVILITHFMEEALAADRTVVLNRGEIVMQGPPEVIFSRCDELETFNLSMPAITSLGHSLKKGGLEITDVLHHEQLAAQIVKNLNNCGIYAGETPKYTPPEQLTGGEWDIDICGLEYTYSKNSPFASQALKGIDLHISEGEFFGIIGHTGSGKSTLVQHLNALIKLPQAEKKYRPPKLKKGQEPPALPSIKVGPYDLGNKKTDFNALRANVGMVFQYPEYQLFAETVFKDVAFGLKNFNKNISEEDAAEAVRQSLEVVGLDYAEVKDKSPFDLSGGQMRRAAIAGVIVTKPKILILDEPAAGLDPKGKKEIMELLHTLHREWCKTIIIVSHDMDEVAENCTRAAVISGGKVVMCGAPAQIFAQTEALVSLGLDVPLTSKIAAVIAQSGITVHSDCTREGFAQAVIKLYRGCGNA